MIQLIERMMEAQKRQREAQTRLISHESNMVVLTNNSGLTLDHGDVVVINPNIDSSVDVADSASQQGPLVVVSGDVVGSATKCAYVGYGTINIMCDGSAIAPGDAVGTSATPTYGAKLDSPTIQTILGIATTSKAEGIVAEVTIIVLAGGGAAAVVGGGGGWRYATVVVAASNSTDLNKAGADYVCDGTADEVTINDAVGLCVERGGGKVLLLEGDYIMAAHINLESYVHIQGMGPATVLRQFGATPIFRNASPAQDMVISDLQWVYNSTATGRYGIDCYSPGQVTNLKVERVTTLSGRYIAYIRGGVNVSFSDCTFMNAYYGLHFRYSSISDMRQVSIHGNHFYYCGQALFAFGDQSTGDAPSHEHMRDFLFVDNTVIGDYDYYNPAYPNHWGVSVYGTGNFTISGNSFAGLYTCVALDGCANVAITGNTFRSFYSLGVYTLSMASKSGRVSVTGNAFSESGGNAVGITGLWDGLPAEREEDPTVYAVVSGNYIQKCVNSIAIQLASRVEVSDNIITEDESVPIELIDAWEVLIANNMISESLYGMQISDVADSLQIMGNYLIDIGMHGMDLATVSNFSIVDNAFYGIGTDLSDAYDAIYLRGSGLYGGCDRGFIQGNFMRPGFAYNVPTARYGINLSTSACENNIVAWNDLRDFALSGEINDLGTGTWISQYQAAGGIAMGTLTDYTEVEPDGTLHFNGDATVWDDVRVGVYGMRNGAVAPDFVNSPAFAGDSTLYYYAFNGAGVGPVEEMYFDVQLPHGYKTGTDIYAHVHFAPTSTNGGDVASRNVRWKLTYTWANYGSTFPGTATIDMDTSFVPNTSLWRHLKSGDVAISGAAKGISSMLVCRLFRDPADNDDYPQDVALLEVDFHFELDTVGSRQQSAK